MKGDIGISRISTLIIIIFGGFLISAFTSYKSNDLKVQELSTEYFANPIGIDDAQPRLSWKITSENKGTRQTAYQVQVAQEADFSKQNMLWDTEKVSSGESVHVRYEGPELESKERYYWRLRVWDNHGNRSPWSDTSFWEMGLLKASDWQAEWIEPALEEDTTQSSPSPMLRKEFYSDGQIKSARAYVTSRGLYEMKINGQKVGDQVFTPGWTSYQKRLQYQVYDIAHLLESGNNAVGVILGDGWYRGQIGFNDQRNFYGTTLGLLAQIEITYEDGDTEVIGTDGSWRASTGPIRSSDIYNGEMYDARLEENWSVPEYNDDDWLGVEVANYNKDNLVAPEGPPVKKIQELEPVEILTTSEGDTVVDMGQNLVGWVRMNVVGPEGTEVTFEHAEVLDKEGNFYTENLRAADQKNTYILKGDGKEIYEPHFTFQGFRYVKVEGYPGALTKDDLTAVVIHSDMDPTGHFETSNPLINQLQHNIVWGQKGNFLDIPTDCPQRDERLGWTGDIQVFAQTACYNMDSAGFLTKWLRDVEADQLDNGSVPFVVPNVLGEDAAGASGWADASVIVPWTVYQAYGDVDILKTQYESMKRWVEFVRKRAQINETAYLWDSDFTFGDWLSFNSTASDYPGAYTDKNLISTAYFARSTDLLRRSAKVLGKEGDAKEYAALFEEIKKAFQNEYLTPNGRILSNTQTAYLLALQFDLLPEDKIDESLTYLLSRINERGHLTTGFLGTPHLNPVLSEYGYDEQAFKLLLRKDYPSWLYPVTRGATTIWERWDGIKPDSSFQDEGMNSFNHYAYGAIGKWLYQTVAGIEAASPGFKQIAIRPTPGGGLSYARSLKNSMYGKIVSEWEVSEEQFTLTVVIPENTTATITLPQASDKEIIESEQGDYIERMEESEDDVILNVGSGQYTFTYPMDMDTEMTKNGESEKLNIESTLAHLIAHKESREVLKEYVPALMNSPWLSQVMGFSLPQIEGVLPDDLRISSSEIAGISKEFKDL